MLILEDGRQAEGKVFQYRLMLHRDDGAEGWYRLDNDWVNPPRRSWKADPKGYRLGWEGEIEAENKLDACERLYFKFNTAQPDGYAERPMQVGDIVEIGNERFIRDADKIRRLEGAGNGIEEN